MYSLRCCLRAQVYLQINDVCFYKRQSQPEEIRAMARHWIIADRVPAAEAHQRWAANLKPGFLLSIMPADVF